MNLYESTLDQIKKNKKIREEGKLISIPWKGLPRFSKVLPGIIKEQYTIVTGQQKSAKSQITDFLYVYQVVDFLFNNPDSGITAKIRYYSLEMSSDAKMRQVMSYRLFQKYRIGISPQKLRSVFEGYIVDDKIISLIEQEKEWFGFFESIVEYITDIRNPYGIYSDLKNYCESTGTYSYKNINWYNDDTKRFELRKAIDQYIPNNPNEIIIAIVDHASLLQIEAQDRGDLQKTMLRFSSEYCLHLRDRYKLALVVIQQQSPDSEKQQFTNTGSSIIDKLKPTADGLGDMKRSSRDANLMLGVFGPYKYGVKTYNGYNLERLQDNYRELSILLNRDGISNATIGLYFNGASNYFAELPKSNEIKESDYSAIENIRVNNI